eukprot:scaffold92596_cov75-Phaeocystis_antarctica.AAC.1
MLARATVWREVARVCAASGGGGFAVAVPAFSRAALASTLARAMVWREVAHVCCLLRRWLGRRFTRSTRAAL